MNNLLHLLFANGSFFTFVLLQIVSLYCLVSFNDAQRAIALETWSVRFGSVKSVAENARSYLDLEEQNEAQLQEIARLRELLPEATYDTDRQIDSFSDDRYLQRYNYLTAHIVNRSPYRPNNTLIIDRGSKLGVRAGQGVVGTRGLVGIVDRVTGNHARVLSILHQDIRVSAGLATGDFGTMRWGGHDSRYVTVTDLADYIEVEPGDTVFTTGYSNVFPTRMVIGFVESAEVQPGTGSQDVVVRLVNQPLVDADVFIVQDLFKEELGELNQD